jgi:hypothetical protein
MLVTCALRAPAPVNLGVRNHDKTHLMQKPLSIAFIASVLALAAQAQPKEKSDLPTYIFGKTKISTSAGTGVEAYFCRDESPIQVPAGEIVPVSGIKTCTPKYGTEIEKFFEIGYRGKIRYIRQNELLLTPESLKKLEAATEDELISLQASAPEASKMVYKVALKDAWDKIQKTKSSGVAILKYGLFDESEYTDGTGFEITYYNSSKKIIKYINATIVGYNAVGDPVRSAFGGNAGTSLRGIGPVEPDELATYKKSYAWHTDIVQRMRVVSLNIQYMDGSKSTVKNPSSVVLDRSIYDLITSVD